MKSKKEYLVLIGVAVVLVLYLVFHRSDRTLYELPEMSEIKASAISKLVITVPEKTEAAAKTGETIELVKADGKWRIQPQGYPATESKVDQMIEAITDLQLTAMVSESKNYTRYQLNAGQKITVKAWSDGDLARAFAVGKKVPSTQHTFVKLPDDPKVYHARDNIRYRFDQGMDALRDKTVLSLNPKDVQGIEIRQNEKTVSIVCAPGQPEVEAAAHGQSDNQETAEPEGEEAETLVWQNSRGEAVPKNAVEALLDHLSTLKCQSFITERKKTDFSNPVYSVTLTGVETHTLSIFEKESEDADRHPAISSKTGEPFYLSAYKAKNIMKPIEKE